MQADEIVLIVKLRPAEGYADTVVADHIRSTLTEHVLEAYVPDKTTIRVSTQRPSDGYCQSEERDDFAPFGTAW